MSEVTHRCDQCGTDKAYREEFFPKWRENPSHPCATEKCHGFFKLVTAPTPETYLPTDSQARKDTPMATGLLDYFPAALAEVARLSKAGNDKHNPGQPLHHSRAKSGDHADCIIRHLADRGIVDPEDGFLHEVKVAWRALALVQEELERRGAKRARAAKEV